MPELCLSRNLKSGAADDKQHSVVPQDMVIIVPFGTGTHRFYRTVRRFARANGKTCRVGFDIGTRRFSLNLQRDWIKTSRINQMWTGTLRRSAPSFKAERPKAERRRGGIALLMLRVPREFLPP
jgi:hypothetical protein